LHASLTLKIYIKRWKPAISKK